MRYARTPSPRRVDYVDGYLRSIPWFRRRDRWFNEELVRHGAIRCVLCERQGRKSAFELHHLDYSGVSTTPHGWHAGEAHDDLVAAHPRCHEWIHQVLDRDGAASAARDRRTANQRVIARLRAKFAHEIAVTTTGESR